MYICTKIVTYSYNTIHNMYKLYCLYIHVIADVLSEIEVFL